MSRLDVLFDVVKEAKSKEAELIKGYQILSIRQEMTSDASIIRLRIVLTDNYRNNERTNFVTLYIREEYDLFFIDSKLNNKKVVEVAHIPIDGLATGLKGIEEEMREAEKELEKENAKEDEVKEVFRNQLGIS